MSSTDCMRIAVALTALRHKPPLQSVPSCVLDLQTAFASTGPFPESANRRSSQWWRAHALHLENESAQLKAQLDAERLKNALLSQEKLNEPTQPTPTVPSNDSQPLAEAGKKKSKKKSQPQGPQREVTTGSSTSTLLQSQAQWSAQLLATLQEINPHSSIGNVSPMVAIDHLFKISATMTRLPQATTPTSLGNTGQVHQQDHQSQLLLASASAAIQAISLELGSTILMSITSRSSPTNIATATSTATNPCSTFSSPEQCLLMKTLDVYAAVLQNVVSTIVPLFGRGCSLAAPTSQSSSSEPYSAKTSAPSLELGACLRLISKHILQPCLRSFVPLSICLLEDMCCGGEDGHVLKDLRFHILALLRTLFTALFSLPKQPSLISQLTSLRMSLVLDTLKELKQTLLSDRTTQAQTCATDKGRHHDRANASSESKSKLKLLWDAKLTSYFPPRTTTRSSSAEESSSSPSSSSSSRSSRAPPTSALRDYERHLAKKDGLWFLCSVLHLLSSFDGLCGPRLGSVLSSASSPYLSISPSTSRSTPISASSSVLNVEKGETEKAMSMEDDETTSTNQGWDVTCQHMRQAIIDDTLYILSNCNKASVVTRNRAARSPPNRNLRGEEEAELVRLESSGQDVHSHVTQAPANPHREKEPGEGEAERITDTTSEAIRGLGTARGKRGGEKVAVGKKNECYWIDDAESAMILAAAERLFFVYAA